MGRFISRPNRFLAIVELPRSESAAPVRAEAHIKDSGRLRELLFPGNLVALKRLEDSSRRRTSWDLVLAWSGSAWVSLDPSASSHLIQAALQRGTLPEFSGYTTVRREAKYGESRLDFFLDGEQVAPAFVEVKSVTLVRGDLALFPDAPTLRGSRHLQELQRARQEGYGAFVVFVVQREDALAVAPNAETDGQFTRAMVAAARAGVRVLAYRCRVGLREIALESSSIPVIVPGEDSLDRTGQV
ncbi:MAG: DNA/RNA nuclease SfsA [Firmicutes bacterium]|nr:DNA/RNA nuclease SfsA [Candidatus Fermentithermobacillaceae bacterium]